MTTPKVCHVDFETKSRIDLLKAGAYRYAQDPSTDIICMAYAFDDEDVELWTPGYSFPIRLYEYVENGGLIYAHNAQFERLIWWYVLENDYGAPPIKMDQFICTAAQARVNGLPGALADLSVCLGLTNKKDFRGNQLIQKLSIPDKETGQFFSSPTLLKEMYDYCKQDVRAERELSDSMRALTKNDIKQFLVSERINDRGIHVDVEFAKAAFNYAKEEQDELVGEIIRATDGAVVKARGPKLTKWVYERLGFVHGSGSEELQEIMHVWKKGERKLTLDARTRQALLDHPKLPWEVSEVVGLSDDAQASSTAKYTTMSLAADVCEDRIRGASLFCGATATGRWSGRLIQPQNFPRDGFPDELSEKIRELIVDNYEVDDICDASGHGIMQTLKRMLRYTLCAAEGNTLIASDWSSIEGRALPWLANSPKAHKKLDGYREGVCMYKLMATKIFKVSYDDVTKAQRQVGKVAELALGYGGGKGAFQSMARGFGIFVTDAEAESIKLIWRQANPWAQKFWHELSKAAMDAVRNPYQTYRVGRIAYTFRENYLGGSLFCLLPSGRMLTYPQAKVQVIINRWGNEALELSAIKASFKPKGGSTDWPRHGLWGGLLAENVTQATCACLLRNALDQLDSTDKVIIHVHDEIVMEAPASEGEKYKALLLKAMSMDYGWAEGLPLESDAWVGTHYRK